MTRQRPRTPRPAGRGSRLGDERGATAALVALFLPCLVAAVALIIDAGALLVARAQMAAAADMGALAGVQDLDYDLLASDGRLLVLEEPARADAEAWVRGNLEGRAFIAPETVSVAVTVCNPGSGVAEPVCPVTGRLLTDPTVCVLVRAEARLPFLPGLGPVGVSVHADASVVGRP